VKFAGARLARLILNCDVVDLVTHELAGDVITIGRAPLNHVVIGNPPTAKAIDPRLNKAGLTFGGCLSC